MLAECVLDARSMLGESPFWCPKLQKLYWIDVGAPSLNRFDPSTGKNEVWLMPTSIGAAAPADDGRIAVALRNGLHLFDLETGALTLMVDPEPDQVGNRLNDGRCDARGRFWIGSMLDPVDQGRAEGQLHSISGQGSRTWRGDIVISNGLAFSPDNKTLYHSDSFVTRRTIWAYDFDLDDGVISNRRVFVDTTGMGGRPDGAAVDVDGCYWSAAADGWAVVRYTPRGDVDRVIRMPVSKPSMPAFGGCDGKTLFVTSLCPPGLDTRDQPLAGGIFAIDVGVAGLPENAFAVP